MAWAACQGELLARLICKPVTHSICKPFQHGNCCPNAVRVGGKYLIASAISPEEENTFASLESNAPGLLCPQYTTGIAVHCPGHGIQEQGRKGACGCVCDGESNSHLPTGTPIHFPVNISGDRGLWHEGVLGRTAMEGLGWHGWRKQGRGSFSRKEAEAGVSWRGMGRWECHV